MPTPRVTVTILYSYMAVSRVVIFGRLVLDAWLPSKLDGTRVTVEPAVAD